jgi:hypothetical protein
VTALQTRKYDTKTKEHLLLKQFLPKRDEVTVGWKKLHSEKLYTSYSSPNIFRQIKSRIKWWAGHMARMGEESKVCWVFGGKSRRKESKT